MYTKQSWLALENRSSSFSKDSSFVQSEERSARDLGSVIDKIRGPMTLRDPRKTVDGSLFFTLRLNDDKAVV